MLAYLVLVNRDQVPVDESLVNRFTSDGLPEIPFHADERTIWQNRDRHIVFFGWQIGAEAAGIGSHWTTGEQGLTAFSGHCWPHATGWKHGIGRTWAEQLRSHLGDESDPATLRETLFGHFTIISLTDHGAGWIMPDWANVDQFFVAETPHGFAISNRAGLCARAMQIGNDSPQRSPIAAGWLIGEGSIIDQESGYWDVERPRAGSMVVIEPQRGAHIIESFRSPLYPPTIEEPAPIYDRLLNEVDDDLRATIRVIADLPVEQRVLSLSGGKDSRTLLAFILREDLQDRFQFVTHGSPERADVIIARSIAQRFGLDWTWEDTSERSLESEMTSVFLHAGLVEGMTSAWAAMEPHELLPGVAINGTSGEGLRWGPVSGSGVGARSIDEIIARVEKNTPFDVLKVLQPSVRAYYVDYVRNWFHEQTELGIPLVSLPALYFHERKMHARTGVDAMWNARLRTDPFMTPVCIRATHRLAVEHRPDLRFHLDLQRRCCLELSKLPLTAPTWSESMYAHLPDANDYRQLQPVHTRTIMGKTWRMRNYATYRPAIEQIVLDRGNPIHELVDYDRLVDRVRHGGEHEGRTRLIWGVLSAAVWMGKYDRPANLERHDHVGHHHGHEAESKP